MKDHLAETIVLFKSGFHCAQAVIAPFGEELGLSRDTALKIASPFGGGMGGYGRTCGALTGAMLAVGLKYGTDQLSDPEAMKLCKDKTRELIETFERVHGTSICNELVGFDRSNMQGAELMAKIPFFHNTCPKFRETVITFLEEEL